METPSTPVPVFLTDGLLRKTLAAARSLGRHGIPVRVAEAVGRPNPSAWTRFCTGGVRYPDPARDPSGFLQWVEATARRHTAVWLWMDDAAMDVVVRAEAQLSSTIRCVLPPEHAYEAMRDKARAAAAAAACGLMPPETWWRDAGEDMAWHGLEGRTRPGWADVDAGERLPQPLVVRPRRGSGSRGLRVVRTGSELQAALQRGAGGDGGQMVQTYVWPGERIDVCLLLDASSHCVAGFIQRELRHFPYPHGPSTAQESVVDAPLLNQCRRMAESLRWRGVIEFEFMRDGRTGDLRFMEANTRFWNSLHCAILAGIDFPWLYYQVALGRPVSEQFVYPPGVRCTSWLPGDALARWARLRWTASSEGRMQEAGWGPSTASDDHRASLLRTDDRPTFVRDDILSWRDPLPTVGYLAALARLALRPDTWRDLIHR